MANAVCCPLYRAVLPEGRRDFNIPTNFRIKRFIEIFQKRTTLHNVSDQCNLLKFYAVAESIRKIYQLLVGA